MKIIFQNARITSRDVDPADYHKQVAERGSKDYVMSRGELIDFDLCPIRWRRGHKDSGPTAATEWGNLMDTRVLAFDQFFQRYVIQPATFKESVMQCPKCKSETDAAKCRKCGVERVPVERDTQWDNRRSVCQAWCAEQKAVGKEVVTHERFGMISTAWGALHNDGEVVTLIAESDHQVEIRAEYHDRATGIVVPVKALIDLLPWVTSPFRDSVADFKASVNVNPAWWHKAVEKWGWDVQGAFYLDLAAAATGREFVDFRHLAQESFAPYHHEKIILSAEMIELGRLAYRTALARYAQCLATNVWPAYRPTATHFGDWSIVEPSAYAQRDVVQRMASHPAERAPDPLPEIAEVTP